MAGLVPAIHVVGRIKRLQVSSKDGKPSFCKSLPVAEALSDTSLTRRGVDGRDKPAMTKTAHAHNHKRQTNS